MENPDFESRVRFLKTLTGDIDNIISDSGQHSVQVARGVVVIANRMGLKKSELDSLWMGALLHDIGKIGIPRSILTKDSPLNEDEWRLIQLHPVIGQSIIQASHSIPEVADLVYLHQEKYNGGGYPVGLAGNDIPLSARIIAVVDAYDAMTDNRPYRRACPPKDALDELQRMSGEQFDPLVVDVFSELLASKCEMVH